MVSQQTSSRHLHRIKRSERPPTPKSSSRRRTRKCFRRAVETSISRVSRQPQLVVAAQSAASSPPHRLSCSICHRRRRSSRCNRFNLGESQSKVVLAMKYSKKCMKIAHQLAVYNRKQRMNCASGVNSQVEPAKFCLRKLAVNSFSTLEAQTPILLVAVCRNSLRMSSRLSNFSIRQI